MNATLLGLLAETSIHPGAGSDAGFVDLPVAREAATDYPVIVGSSVKGALLHRFKNDGLPEWKKIFGQQDNAGSLVVSDARLLLLPVRSMTGQYRWITCPHLIERFQRDRSRAGLSAHGMEFSNLGKKGFLGGMEKDQELFLEERQFMRNGELPDGLIELVQPLIAHDQTRQRLANQLVVLHNDDFIWFARFGLAVNARNVLDDQKKTSMNLWYEETIPPDSLFYLLLAERISPAEGQQSALKQILSLFDSDADQGSSYLQVGGNMTVGQGFFAVTPVLEEGANA